MGIVEVIDMILCHVVPPSDTPRERLPYVTTPFTNTTMLHEAAKNGHRNVIERLLEFPNTEVNARALFGYRALHFAAEGGHCDAIDCLLAAPDIDVNALCENGRTPLHLAVTKNHLGATKSLTMAPNIDVSAIGPQGWTPLLYAAHGDRGGIDRDTSRIIEYLKTVEGVDVHAIDDERATVLHLAALNGTRNVLKSCASI